MAPHVAAITRAGVPVIGHIGLTPQRALASADEEGEAFGTSVKSAMEVMKDALALEAAGADMVLLECIPAALGRGISQALKVPVIGIGAGPDTDGQILVLYDILDITPGRKPRFVRNFMAGAESPQAAVARYVQAVKSGDYPAPEHCF